MSEKFSATLRIGDLNDYIAPSQGCVVSLKANSNRLEKSEVTSYGSCFLGFCTTFCLIKIGSANELSWNPISRFGKACLFLFVFLFLLWCINRASGKLQELPNQQCKMNQLKFLSRTA